MARKAELIVNTKSLFVEFKKVDRKKIYGWSSIETFDDNQEECILGGLAEGQYIIPKGGSALVTLNQNGESVIKKDLIGVNNNGEKVSIVPSIYEQKTILEESSIDEYLTLTVKSVYQIISDENIDIGEKIYKFSFNYRADYEGDDAFLIKNENTVFAVVGKITKFNFIGLKDNETDLVENEESNDEDLDFAMF